MRTPRGLGLLKWAVDLAGEAVNLAAAGIGHEVDHTGLARLEPDGGAGRDVQPEAPRLLPVEGQRRVRLEEVIVRADLDRPVAGIRHVEGDRISALVQVDLAGPDEQFARYHQGI